MKHRLSPGCHLLILALAGWVVGCRAVGLSPVEATSAPVAPSAGFARTPEGIVPQDPYTRQREAMVRDQIAARGIADPAVLDALRAVPRHEFVPERYQEMAYDDHPLPIGYGQTISQPYIVALMTEVLAVSPRDRVLEVGTGSGYQAAVLAEMGVETYTVEIIPQLAEQAASKLKALNYTNVHTRTADGYLGWPEEAPFDAIIVTAAPDHVPQPLVQQLREGGRLVIPIGPQGSFQTLWLFEKQGGELTATNLGSVMFVPLTRPSG